MSFVRSLLRSPITASVLTSSVILLSVLALRLAGSLEALELAAYDWLMRARPQANESDSRVVLITITEEDIQELGKWPLSDGTLARVLATLVELRPRAIGVDIYRDIPIPPGEEDFNRVLRENNHIIGVQKFGDETSRGIQPPTVLEGSNQLGFNDMVVDPGGIVRRGLLFLDDGKTVFYSLSLRLAMLYLQRESIYPQPDPSNPAYLRLGETTIPPFESDDGGYVGADARGYQFLLDFRGGRRQFLSFSLMTLLSGGVEREAIRDRIVIIGTTAESVPDFFYTPFSRGFREKQQIAGLALHAHGVSQLLRFGLEGASPIAVLSEKAEILWIAFWSLLGGVVGLRVRSPWRFSIAAVTGLAVLSTAAFLAFQKGWWIPMAPPALSWLIAAAVVTAYMSNREKKERAFLMSLFSRHVSNEVAESVWKERDQFMDGGRPLSQKLTATVLFTDIVGFTSVSEHLDPKSLMDWLNEYMEAMGQQVIEHDGVINKYIGDAIMAVFGVPVARKTKSEMGNDATKAVQCALAMGKTLVELNRAWQTKGLPAIGMRIGIFTGPLVAGSLGSAQRLEYTVIGDTVNTASRLESFDKDGFDPDSKDNPCRIFVGEATLRYLDGRFETERVGEVRLKGKDQEITVYRVLGKQEASP